MRIEKGKRKEEKGKRRRATNWYITPLSDAAS
jgi:hypothetical protein